MEEIFRVEAVFIIVYFINMFFILIIEFRILEELWSGFKLSLSYLRRFRWFVYVYTGMFKISIRVTKGYFVGYY